MRNEITQEQMFEHITHLLGPCELCDEIKDAIAERDRLAEELGAIVNDLSFLQPAADAEEWGARLSQVAAKRLRKAEAELSTAKTLLDAAMELDTRVNSYWRLAEAAREYRKSKGKE